jgi:(2Fe-2S) ferredoxin
MKYDYHVFVCANQKPEGKKCCGEETGMEAVKFLREKFRGQDNEKKIRIQRAGCLDLCSRGPALVIYPEGTFYRFQNQDDLNLISEEHLKKGKLVENLVISDEA